MSKVGADEYLLPSLMDRLVTTQSGIRSDPKGGRAQQLKYLKESVRQDLERLLNTRWRCRQWPPGLDELEGSLVNYGIPDCSAADLGSPDGWVGLRDCVERAIRHFEPRFKNVRVELPERSERLDGSLTLLIHAVLRAEPVSSEEPVEFESRLEPNSTNVRVE